MFEIVGWVTAFALGLLGWMAIAALVGRPIVYVLATAGVFGVAMFFNWIATGHPLPRGPHR